MKLRTLVRIAVTSSVVLLCAGLALYSFFKLSVAESQKDFNLYTLVPSSASVLFITDDAAKFVAEVDELTCSKNGRFLHVSKLFSYLKYYLYTLLEDTPHGLSRQMNQMMISFHAPDNDRNQVLYCRLGDKDSELIDKFVQKYVSSAYPAKTFEHKGEKIIIYPMPDGDFLSCYLTSDFLAISYQKKLIEEVIDARKTGKSLANDPGFLLANRPKKSIATATVYARLEGMIGWTEFDMKLKDDFIYFSGTSHKMDTVSTFINILRRQESVNGFPGKLLPSTAFYFSNQGVTDWASLLSFTGMLNYAGDTRTSNSVESSEELSRFLIENAGHDLLTCLFLRGDTLMGTAAVTSLSVTEPAEAEKLLRGLVEEVSDAEGLRRSSRVSFSYTYDKAYPIYRLPRTTLFTQLANFAGTTLDVYAAFYGERLLLAPDEGSLSQYIRSLDKGKVLDGGLGYQAGTNGLSDSYQFMLMADFDHVFHQPENKARLVPKFFFRNSDFFRNFIFFLQLARSEEAVHLNIVLKYKVGPDKTDGQ